MAKRVCSHCGKSAVKYHVINAWNGKHTVCHTCWNKTYKKDYEPRRKNQARIKLLGRRIAKKAGK